MKRPRRRGSILLLVLVMVPALALAGYSFTHWMRAEASGSVAHLRATQALWLAHSGIEYAQALLADPVNTEPGGEDLENNPALFGHVVVTPSFRNAEGYFSLVAPSLVPNNNEIRYGFVNESAKIPLHRKRFWGQGKPEEQRDRLVRSLPNMTPELADCLLDWIDKDNEPRPLGAEADYYLALDKPYSPRNAPPRTIGELLLVRGVTAWHLYGEDANLDGILGANENDGNKSWPPDNGDGTLDRGWFPFITIYSAASDLNPDGEAKIDVNSDLTSQQSRLVELFGQEWFEFVQQWKAANPGKKVRALSEWIDVKVEPKNQGGGGGRGNPGLPFPLPGGNPNEKKVIESPWTSRNVADYLDQALSYLTVEASKDSTAVRGRVDVTRAAVEVLRAMPGLKEGTADAIASAAQGRAAGDETPAWLLVDGIVTLDEFRAIEALVTSQNRVYRLESVGFFSMPGPTARVEAVIDATKSPARVRYRRELVSVGSAYPQEALLSVGTFMQTMGASPFQQPRTR